MLRTTARPPRWISCTMIGVSVVGLQLIQSSWTPQPSMSQRMRFDASSPFNRTTGKASQSRHARIESTLPQVPLAHVRRFARQLKIMSDSSIRDENLVACRKSPMACEIHRIGSRKHSKWQKSGLQRAQ